MLPAVSEASEVVSRFSVAPTLAMSWPFLSTRKTIFALASRDSFSQTALICWNSSSYITICGCIARPLPLLSRWGDANRRRAFGLEPHDRRAKVRPHLRHHFLLREAGTAPGDHLS